MKGAEYATGYCPNSTIWMQIRQLSTGPDVQLREDCNIKRATIANLTGPGISFRCNWKHYESDVKCMISWLCGSLGEWLRWQQVTHDLLYRISYFLYLARTLFVLYCIYGRYNKVFFSKYLGLLDITCMCFVILHCEAEPKLIVYQWWPSSFTAYDVWSPHWGRDKMAAVFLTTFWNAFSWIKIHEFYLRFHWNVFGKFELTIFHHWFR